ncbi:hypothetical protein FHS42_003962 [Streptomyces zagrosensis]|uniref:Uncharacterized protein n=1 Tax=Streptomyces zagrosensis TaxID=1042984 RepID=A0A7W9UZC4_9ACTN|nr:hypothetical protein [Streptomyces zagrosensis]
MPFSRRRAQFDRASCVRRRVGSLPACRADTWRGRADRLRRPGWVEHKPRQWAYGVLVAPGMPGVPGVPGVPGLPGRCARSRPVCRSAPSLAGAGVVLVARSGPLWLWAGEPLPVLPGVGGAAVAVTAMVPHSPAAAARATATGPSRPSRPTLMGAAIGWSLLARGPARAHDDGRRWRCAGPAVVERSSGVSIGVGVGRKLPQRGVPRTYVHGRWWTRGSQAMAGG